MTFQCDTLLRRSYLMGRKVFDSQTRQEIGQVSQIWIDWQTHLLVGLTCSFGFWGRNTQSFRWLQIERVDRDRIFVSQREGASGLIEETVTVDFRIGHTICTSDGRMLGSLVDYCIEPYMGVATHYLFSMPNPRGVTDDICWLPAKAVMSVDSRNMIVHSSVMQASNNKAASGSTLVALAS